MCKAAITNLQMTIHPIPSALVGHGKRVYQDIHEGVSAFNMYYTKAHRCV